MDAEALDCADPENFAKLARGFPKEAKAIREWKAGNMLQRLREKGFSL